MLRSLRLSAVLFMAPAFAANFTVYTSLSSFQAAVSSLQQQSANFENFTAASTSPSIAVPGGVTISGDFIFTPATANGGVRISDSAFMQQFFLSNAGQGVSGAGNLLLTLPSNVYGVAFNMGASFVIAANISGTVNANVTPAGGPQFAVPLSMTSPFPFLGIVSDAPISSLALNSGTFLTLDNLIVASSIPEPATTSFLLLFASMAAIMRRRRQ